MFKEHFVYFINGDRYAGPFMSFEAAFSHAIRYQTDFRIENAKEQVLATWSLWTGLYKVGVTYKYLVVDCDFNRKMCPDIVGQIFDKAPQNAIVQDVEAA